MCEKAVKDDPYDLELLPDHLKTQEMCERAVEKTPWCLEYVPDQFKTQEMCDKAVKDDSFFCSLSLIGLIQKSG